MLLSSVGCLFIIFLHHHLTVAQPYDKYNITRCKTIEPPTYSGIASLSLPAFDYCLDLAFTSCIDSIAVELTINNRTVIPYQVIDDDKEKLSCEPLSGTDCQICLKIQELDVTPTHMLVDPYFEINSGACDPDYDPFDWFPIIIDLPPYDLGDECVAENCTECLTRGDECGWCEETQTCEAIDFDDDGPYCDGSCSSWYIVKFDEKPIDICPVFEEEEEVAVVAQPQIVYEQVPNEDWKTALAVALPVAAAICCIGFICIRRKRKLDMQIAYQPQREEMLKKGEKGKQKDTAITPTPGEA